MLNNYDATLTCLAAFLVANAPKGADRDLLSLQRKLDEGSPPDYFSLEFRPEQDVGCSLYVRVEGAEGRYDRARIIDADGNRWYGYKVACEVSWCSWGSADVTTCQRRLACMTEVLRFACEVERVFAGVFHRLDATADQIKEQEAKWAKEAAAAAAREAVLKHAKGMKVGDTKSVVVDPKHDLTGLGKLLVERKEGGRTFKYSAEADSTSHVGQLALVWFMRIEA